MNEPRHEIEDLEVERRLESERPVPHPGYRARLRANLLSAAGAREASPRRLRLLIAVYAGAGALLLFVAGIGVAGAGPLAA